MSKTPAAPRLGPLVESFFCERLQAQQQASPNTLGSYRDTVRLLLGFVEQKTGQAPDQQTLGDWNSQTILGFLDHLEKQRGCQARTRNLRLAALRTFMRYVSHRNPEMLALTSQVLAIPLKRFDRQLIQPLSVLEVQAILAATDTATESGRRDHLLFNFLYHTGARISEVLQLRQQDLHWGGFDTAALHGKGRKERVIPLLKPIARELKRALDQRPPEPTALVFENRFGRPLGRWGAQQRLRLAVQRAAQQCPSLQGRAVSPHTFRHYADLRTMPTGTKARSLDEPSDRALGGLEPALHAA
jgi:integrase/recombinase XerD